MPQCDLTANHLLLSDYAGHGVAEEHLGDMFGRDARVGQRFINGGHGQRSDSAARESAEWRHANTGDQDCAHCCSSLS
jgi:hypothetical protein